MWNSPNKRRKGCRKQWGANRGRLQDAHGRRCQERPAEGASPREGSQPERQNNNPLFAISRLGCVDSASSSQGQIHVLGMGLSSLPAGCPLAPPFLDIDIARTDWSRNQGETGVVPPTVTPKNSLKNCLLSQPVIGDLVGLEVLVSKGEMFRPRNTVMGPFTWKLRLPLIQLGVLLLLNQYADKGVTVMEWMFMLPQNLYIEAPTHNVMVLGGGPLESNSIQMRS